MIFCRLDVVSQQVAWERWNLEDNARAELPLTDDQDRASTFPRGFAISLNSKRPVPISMFAWFLFWLFWFNIKYFAY